jgi:energy-coupling factor transporter ATP-binding protein EcfA2
VSGRDLDRRLAALAEVVELAAGRFDAGAAAAVVERAGARLGLGIETTVVALAGPTGAGKSTLFNALAGAELTRAGVRRPTTAAITAAVRGDVDPALLDWLKVRSRHVLEGAGDGFVLLDLPDYDSVESAHRDEVDRVIELADLLVWVVDPQKYADAALHDRYLRPLSSHGEVMVLVLNQADRLDPAGLDACRADLVRLLTADGLPGVPVLAVSATTGAGLPELQRLLRARAADRAAAADRLGADVRAAAAALAPLCEGRPGKVDKADRTRLTATLADAAGVPVVVQAVAAAHRRRGALTAGWPLGRWVRRLRPDPLKRLRLNNLADSRNVELPAKTSIPRATVVQGAQVSSAARTLAATAAGELVAPWPSLLRSAATKGESGLAEQLDRAVAGVDLKLREPRWWVVAGLLQKVFALAALAGALWLVALAGLGYLQLDDAIPTPDLEGFPVPTLLLGGGLLAGVLLALVARWLNGIGARRRAGRAQRALHDRVDAVAEATVVAPVRDELDARERLCRALKASR